MAKTRSPLRRLKDATDRLNIFAESIEAENRRLLDEMVEDENRVRFWKLVVIGADGERHTIPLKCSRGQVRKVKIALHNAGADALSVER